ncbi:MAG: HAD hydrolase-like protein [Chloroflexi bacterium]|nr:HAD hydrolase-like protein [Chloroflexota bacterium]
MLDAAPYVTIGELLDQFEVILFDSDGVLVSWPSVIAGASEAIEFLNHEGRQYFVITNDASMIAATRAARYAELGLAIDPARIISSGMLLKTYFEQRGLGGARCVVLGTEDSASFVVDAGGQVVPSDADFDVLVIGDQEGFPLLETTGNVLGTLFRKIAGGEFPHLVLPNPDLYYPTGDGFSFASGAVAAMFESALVQRFPGHGGLTFSRLGKPHPAIFEEVIRRSGTESLIMIGDTPGTDIRGANNMGITSVLVNSGAAPIDLSTLPPSDIPTYRLKSLAL